MKIHLFALTFILLTVSSQGDAGAAGNARYDIILSRKPFGTPPPAKTQPTTPAKPPPTAAQLNFAKTLRVAYLRRTEPEGLRAGIVDSKTKKSYVLQEGEKDDDGLELRQIDFDKGSALVARGSVEVWITAGTSPSKTPAPSRTSHGSTGGTQSTRYQEILKRRQEEMRKRAELMRRQRSGR
jgi:hypothetical protein